MTQIVIILWKIRSMGKINKDSSVVCCVIRMKNSFPMGNNLFGGLIQGRRRFERLF